MLLVQRQPDKHDPGEAYARWEFPGGKLDPDDLSVWAGAVREWSEETGATLPDGVDQSAGWVDGKYEGFVVRVPSETDLTIVPQPGEVSAVAWWNVDDLDDPRVRDKVVEALDLVQPLLKSSDFHRHTDRIVDHYTPLIAAALADIFALSTIRAAVTAAYQDSDVQKGVGDTVRAVLVAASRQIDRLRTLLASLYRDAAIQGAREAANAAKGNVPPVYNVQVPDGYWADWQPGVHLPDIGLAGLLEELDIRIAGIVDTEIDLIGNTITEAIGKGFPVAETVKKVREVVTDSRRAWLIAETEYARAMTIAARATYEANGVPRVRWLAQPDCCPRCRANLDVSPIALGDTWPSGDVPVHPRCRCAEAPDINIGS